MDREAQKATVLGVTKSWTQLSMHAYTKLFRHYPKGSGKPLKHIKQEGARIRNHIYGNSPWVLCGLGGSKSGMADETGPLLGDTSWDKWDRRYEENWTEFRSRIQRTWQGVKMYWMTQESQSRLK